MGIYLGFRYQGDKLSSHTNPYNLRHCVIQIVTLKLQRDVTKIQTLTEIGLPVLAWHQVSLLCLQERGSIVFFVHQPPNKKTMRKSQATQNLRH